MSAREETRAFNSRGIFARFEARGARVIDDRRIYLRFGQT